MKTSIVPLSSNDIPLEKTTWLNRLSRKMVFTQLDRLEYGEIVIHENKNQFYFGKTNDEFPTAVHLQINHSSVWCDVAFGGSSGSGEAYIKGGWSCNDLVGLVRIFLRNKHVLDDLDSRMTRFRAPANRFLHWLSRNTRKGSRRNICAHYDVGNDLFELFLDPTMMYSSAYYSKPDMSLDQAAIAKLDQICRKLDLTADDHVLEIGTGWGGFAIHAASHYGCRVTTTTISTAQYELARQRIDAAGLLDRITLLKQDYRDLEGEYDKLVSIEMIEAIGHQYLNTYFEQCSRLLKQDGMMLLQAITIADQRYKMALKDVDFIKKFIFPGGFLPSISVMSNAIANASSMKIFHLQDIGPHYALTLNHWRDRFLSRLEEVRQLGYSDSFIRLWEFYLCYCEGGFIERDLGTVQMVLIKPGNRVQGIFGR